MLYIKCTLAYVMVIVAIIRKGDISGALEKALNATGALLSTKVDKVASKIDTLQYKNMDAALEATKKIDAAEAAALDLAMAASESAQLAKEAAKAEMQRKQEKNSIKIGKLTGIVGSLAGLANPALGAVITAIGSGIDRSQND